MKRNRFSGYRYIIAAIPFLILIGLLLFATDSAYAGYKSTETVYAWDEVAGKYQNSNVVVTFNGGWVPFFHEMNTFDADEYPTDYTLDPGWPVDACPGVPSSVSTYAGIMQFGLYHTDNNPAGGQGFQRSYEWQIVKCDRDGDADASMDNGDLAVAPGTANMVPFSTIFQVLSVDVVNSCGAGNCQDEVVTTMYVNFDTNCDNSLADEGIPAEGLCFYARAQTPVGVTWGGPLQGRISAGGGDKTVSFSPRTGPTAVTLSSFVGNSPTAGYATVLLALGMGGVALLSWRARRRAS